MIIKKIVEENKIIWDSKLKFVLWANRITSKQSIGKIPFQLVYEMEVMLSIYLKSPVYQLLQHFTSNEEAV
jgi:hypothetical protein